MKQSKITLLISIGTALEYYDLVIYSLLANFISQQFFPGTHRTAAILATFAMLTLGNILRPISGITMGILGDLFGRKKIFTNSMIWMALATLLMGIIPPFATLGYGATLLFCLCRLTQTMAFGAESPGAFTMLSEHIDRKKHGLHFGFLASSMGLGVSLGSFIIWLLTKTLSEQAMATWGFRIPFLLGGILSILGFYLRNQLPETPKFIATKKTVEKLTPDLVKKHIGPAIIAIGMLIFSASFSTFKLVLPLFLREYYHFQLTDIYLIITLGYVLANVVLKPSFGFLADYLGKKQLIIASSSIMLFGGPYIFSLLNYETRAALIAFIIFSQIITSGIAASCFALLPRAFQTPIRYTGVGFSYNIAHIGASFTPLVATYIYGVAKNPNYLVLIFMLLAFITICSTMLFRIREDNY